MAGSEVAFKVLSITVKKWIPMFKITTFMLFTLYPLDYDPGASYVFFSIR